MKKKSIIVSKDDLNTNKKTRTNPRVFDSIKSSTNFYITPDKLANNLDESHDIKSENQIRELVESDNELLKVTTVFPFTLFPDTVIISKEKVTIKHKLFFFSETIRSVLIKDIVNVETQTDIFFGKLEIIDKYFAKVPLTVSFLWKKDATKAREMIQGLITSDRNNIDILKANTQVLKNNLPNLGKTSDDI